MSVSRTPPHPVPPVSSQPRTAPGTPRPALRRLGELRAGDYRPRSVKAELRENLIRKLQEGGPLLPGIVGYDDTAVPQLVHGILSQHDLLLLGLRGQAKTRILRQLVNLLDEWIPILDEVELPDEPLAPMTSAGRALVREQGDDAPIRWLHRSERYREKLATPDVTIADLIGEADLVKHAEGRYLSDEATIHFGLIPRSNRGLFAINELPDLPPRIQVGLFNVLEERDVQVRGYPIRLTLDLMLAFSANPEDYTNRGRIVTPLKDRIGSVIRTHYPRREEDAKRITRENAFLRRTGADESNEAIPAATIEVPDLMHLVVETLVSRARTSPHVNQASGVSVRASIAILENVVSSAERRAIVTGERRVLPRMVDFAHVAAGCRGKIELLLGDDGSGSPEGPSTEDRLIDALLGEAVKDVAARCLDLDDVESVAEHFQRGVNLELGDAMPASDAVAAMKPVHGLLESAAALARRLEMDAKDEQVLAGLGEFILEALYVNNRLSKATVAGGRSTYRR